ncbi:tRNA (adenosine(37)-N6)-dimethylallyltransferase MiaA [Planctomicrobium sp. SH664]|uniref:tRNA (adenosine(37)-N6)-dimethylallyltransferase MiaA n=1 Tax=Planctomicrobium sp. SH664 TaxID=3448125 RepID=UPI003F5C6992
MKFPSSLLQRCWFLAGPTAVGKTETSLRLAEQIGAEILSLDSMAVYRGMDIGTAKPSRQEQERCPHHLIDLVDPHVDFSTAAFFTAALESAQGIVDRGRIPLFVGGTGLYLRSLLRGLFEGPSADQEFRRQLESEAEQAPPHWLWQQLQAVDPVTAARLHPNDQRRLIRALEIYRQTGTPPSSLLQQGPLPDSERPAVVVWLHPERETLYRRIDRRVEQMFEQGLIEEVETLLKAPLPLSHSAQQALGYREVVDWLRSPGSSRQELIELIQTRTRQFAKRQHTWFRNLEECTELKISGSETADMISLRIQELAAARRPF